MLVRIPNNVNNTRFSLLLSSVVLMSPVDNLPTSDFDSAQMKITTKSGAEYTWSLSGAVVNAIIASGLTNFNNSKHFIRKSEIESVVLASIDFPQDGTGVVDVTMQNAKVVHLSVDQNNYNLLLS